MRHNLLQLLWLFATISLLSGVALAQAGPPFRTDDPETPGNKLWEINFGWQGDCNSDECAYAVPDFDVNYGLGNRIQLKYELPIEVHEVRANSGDIGKNTLPSPNQFDIDLGESLVGVKWRFYQHSPASIGPDAEDDANFSISTYPQLSLRYPTTSPLREGAPGGPQFLLPIEANARIGPLRVDGEAGYWFTRRNVPQSWIRGIVVGRDFTRRTEAYVELYDQQDANRVDGHAKQREATLGLGGRHALDRKGTVLLLMMGGRSFQKVQSGNAQPGWIGYIGIQLLLGKN
jgi:hypothetical protein